MEKQAGFIRLSDFLSIGKQQETDENIAKWDAEAVELYHVLKKMKIIQDAVLYLEAHPPSAGVVAMLWFVAQLEMNSQKAKYAADVRHSKSGGSRDKQNKICLIWASGKYSSRDICAEQECAALGMSFSSARKALRNIPKPT